MKLGGSMNVLSIMLLGLKRKSEDIIISCRGCSNPAPNGICICCQSMPNGGLTQLFWKSEYPAVTGVLCTCVDSGVCDVEETGVGPEPPSSLDPAGDV